MQFDEKTIASIRTFYDAVLCGETSPVDDFVDWDNLTIREPESLPYGGEYRGADGFRSLTRSIGKHFNAVQFEDIKISTTDNMVITFFTMHVTVRTNNQPVSFPVTEVFILENGKVVHIQPHYWDTHALLNALAANR